MKQCKIIKTVGELKEWLNDVPDATPIGRRTQGYFEINKIGDVSFFVGNLTIGHKENEETKTILSISA